MVAEPDSCREFIARAQAAVEERLEERLTKAEELAEAHKSEKEMLQTTLAKMTLTPYKASRGPHTEVDIEGAKGESMKCDLHLVKGRD